MTTATTPFRETGNTDFDSFLRAISRTWNMSIPGNSPMFREGVAIYDALAPHGLTRLAAAMSWHEQKNATCTVVSGCQPKDYGLAPYHKNPWAIKDGRGGWAEYPSYESAARDFANRLLDPNGPYKNAVTLRDFLMIYAPPKDGNNVPLYIETVCREIDALPLLGEEPPVPAVTMQKVKFAGSTKTFFLPSDIKYSQRLTNLGPNRPGARLNWTGVTQHETGNTSLGADADMHAEWQFNGTPGHPDGKVGVHFYTDDDEIIQCIPINEVSIHSGDERNGTHVSNELCVNRDRNAARAERNAQYLDATLLEQGLNTTAFDDLYPHRSGGCPAIINARNGWNAFEQGVDRIIAMADEQLPPSFPPTIPLPFDSDGFDHQKEGTTFRATVRKWTAKGGGKVYQGASTSSPTVRDLLLKDEVVTGEFVVFSAGEYWVTTITGARIRNADLLPDYPFKP